MRSLHYARDDKSQRHCKERLKFSQAIPAERPELFDMKRPKFFSLVIIFSLLFSPAVYGKSKSLYPGFVPILESQAYQRFQDHPVSDQTKLLYLIDRFERADIEILYDGQSFKPALAAFVARWFLARHYKNQTPKEWILRYCDKSILGRETIWVKLPSGKFRMSREVLFKELQALESVLEKTSSSS